jgi:hypothetical protein
MFDLCIENNKFSRCQLLKSALACTPRCELFKSMLSALQDVDFSQECICMGFKMSSSQEPVCVSSKMSTFHWGDGQTKHTKKKNEWRVLSDATSSLLPPPHSSLGHRRQRWCNSRVAVVKRSFCQTRPHRMAIEATTDKTPWRRLHEWFRRVFP